MQTNAAPLNPLIRTAFDIAQLRALHQLIDRPVVFFDSLAAHVVGMGDSTPIEDKTIYVSSTARAFIAARSRFVEDELANAIECDFKQYLILGAGLDTYAYRPTVTRKNMKIFEVDHPQVQQWKRELLQKIGIAEPPQLTYVAVDFLKGSLQKQLEASGFQFDKPAFISMLGVVIYLERAVIDSIFKLFAQRLPSVQIIFDYEIEDASLNAQERTHRAVMRERAERLGDPLKTFFNQDELLDTLRSMGYSAIENLDAYEINARYFAGRDDKLCVAQDGRRLLSARF